MMIPTGGYSPRIDNPKTAMEEGRPFKLDEEFSIMIDGIVEDKQCDIVVFKGHSSEGQKVTGNCYLRGIGLVSLHPGD